MPSSSSTLSSPPSKAKTACFVFPEASGHINPSLALAAFLTQQKGWNVHYLTSKVMKDCVLSAGATFDDEISAAPELCKGGELSYFAAYEQTRVNLCGPDSKAWEGRAHVQNHVELLKMDGTMDWLRRRNPSVVVYCPFHNRVAQLAALALKIPHVAIITIAGLGAFPPVLENYLKGEQATVDELRQLYETSEMNQKAIDAFCSPPYNLDRALFSSGAPLYYWDLDPPCGKLLGPSENLVTTISDLRDKLHENCTIEEEDEIYLSKCGVRLNYIGPLLGEPGQQKASTHKTAFTIEEQKLLIEQSQQTHRRRSDLHRPPTTDQDNLVEIVKAAKERAGRRVILVSLGTVVTSDRAGFGWHGTVFGDSITGKELVQSVINGVLDAVGLPRSSMLNSVRVDASQNPLIVCAVGQQPDVLDAIDVPPNTICRASVPQVDILRCMDSSDLFVQHGGQNSTMEGLCVGVPMVVCPAFGDQPGNARKLVGLGVAAKVDRPTKGGPESVLEYRKAVANAVRSIQANKERFASAASSMKDRIAASGGEVEAEAVLLRAIERGI